LIVSFFFLLSEFEVRDGMISQQTDKISLTVWLQCSSLVDPIWKDWHLTSENASLFSYGPYVIVLSLWATGLGDLVYDSTAVLVVVTVVVWDFVVYGEKKYTLPLYRTCCFWLCVISAGYGVKAWAYVDSTSIVIVFPASKSVGSSIRQKLTSL
jgi:hypothetical protein